MLRKTFILKKTKSFRTSNMLLSNKKRCKKYLRCQSLHNLQTKFHNLQSRIHNLHYNKNLLNKVMFQMLVTKIKLKIVYLISVQTAAEVQVLWIEKIVVLIRIQFTKSLRITKWKSRIRKWSNKLENGSFIEEISQYLWIPWARNGLISMIMEVNFTVFIVSFKRTC